MKVLLNIIKNNYKILLLVIIGVGMKWVITLLSFTEVRWLLYPVKLMTEQFTGWPSMTTEEGFLFPNQILLSFECSGIHFFTICFLSFWVILFQKQPLFISFLKALLFSYLITIVANTSRILFFISEGAQLLEYIIPKQFAHQFFGGIIFCFWLLAFCFFLTRKNTLSYEVF